MRPSNTIGKHSRANSQAHTICKGKNCCTDSNLFQTCLKRKNTELRYLSVKVPIKMEMPRIKNKSERGKIAQ